MSQRYEGEFVVFAGYEYIEVEDIESCYWEIEPSDRIRNKMHIALEKNGIKCEHIEVIDLDIYEGTVKCKCIYYGNENETPREIIGEGLRACAWSGEKVKITPIRASES